MPLQLDYRPPNLDSFFGNKATVASLRAWLAKSEESRHHTILLTGPSGCGKTTLARIVASELGCSSMDLLQYNISRMRGIDTAREIIDGCQFEALYGKVRVVILNECHQATKEWMNAMLEILEEPPVHTYFILCTTEPEKFIKALKTGRASTFHVAPLNVVDIYALIDWVVSSEEKVITQKVKDNIVHAVEGCPREALAILDTIIDIPEEELQLQAIATTKSSEITTKDIVNVLLSRESGEAKWAKVSILLQGVDQDAEGMRRAIIGYLSAILIKSKGEYAKKLALIIAEFSNNYYDSGQAGLRVSCYMSTLV